VPGKTLLLGADFLISSRIRGGLRLNDRVPIKSVPREKGLRLNNKIPIKSVSREKKLSTPDKEGETDYGVDNEFGAVLKVEG